jgi:carboxypeptidase C (cathepsin A)
MNALRLFYSRFPTYRKNDLYLSAHGYGAVNAAYIAKQIID